MKKRSLLLLVLSFLLSSAYAQVSWTYYSETPILAMDPLVSWGAYGQPTVIIHNDTIRMWYAVAEVTQTDPVVRGRIHYAWSLDGYFWNKHPNNPVFDVGAPLQWDGEWVDTPGILWDGTDYKLYYYGDSLYFDVLDHTAIGLATSNDGIHWTRQGKVLEMGAPDAWDGHHIELPSLYYHSEIGLYAMLYTGMDRVNYPLPGYIRIGLALSWDGYEWFKWYENPVMDVGEPPSFNDIGVGGPALVETNGIFEMWYTGIEAVETPYNSWDSLKVGYAVSLNGTSWIQYPGNPVMQAAEGDSTVFWAFDVVWDPNEELYKMYFESHHWHYDDPYEPGNTVGVNAIFMATAPRTLINSPNCSTSISQNTSIEAGNSVPLFASGGDFYQWDPPQGLSATDVANPIASPEETTTYTVLIVSENCITTRQVQIAVDENNAIDNDSLIVINIYPNPAKAGSEIKLNKHIRDACITIHDIAGNILYRNNIFSGNVLNIASYIKQGIYILQIIEASHIQLIKLNIE